MSKQRVFDTIVKHLATMKTRSVKSEKASAALNTCAYRGEDGAKCAIGALIPDKKYSPVLEGKGATSQSVVAALPKWAQVDVFFLNWLQDVHDTESHWSARGGLNKKGVRQLKHVAEVNKLSLAALQEAFPRINVANA